MTNQREEINEKKLTNNSRLDEGNLDAWSNLVEQLGETRNKINDTLNQ